MLTILITLVLALPRVEEAAPAQEPDWIDLFLEGSRALEQGELETAERALERALELQPHHAPTTWQLAGAMARAGDTTGALDQLESAVAWGGGEAALLRWDPDLVSLRAEVRFEKLLERLRGRETAQPAPEPLIAELVHGSSGFLNSASPEAEIVISGCSGNTFLHDLRAGEILAVLDRPIESTEYVAISPDGRWALTSGSSSWGNPESYGFLRVYEAVTGDFVTELESVGNGASLEFSLDSSRLLAASFFENTSVIWKTDSWTRVGKVRTFRRPLRFSPDGTRILFPSSQSDSRCDVVFWDVDAGRAFRRHEDLKSSDVGLDFSADGALALAQAGGTVHVYEATGGEELYRIEAIGAPFYAAKLLGTGEELVTIEKGRMLRVWNTRTGEVLRSFVASGEDDDDCQLHAPPDGSLVLLTRYGDVLQVFDPATGEPLWTGGHQGHDEIRSVELSPDGTRVVLGHFSGANTVHDARSGELLATLDEPWPRRLARAHPREDTLWLGRSDGLLLQLDAASGRALGRWRHGHAEILDLCFTNRGDLLAAIDLDGVLRVIDSRDGSVVATISDANPGDPRHFDPELAFARDGSALLIAGSGTSYRIFDTSDWSRRCKIVVDGGRLKSGRSDWSWSADGRRFAAAAEGERVWLYDARTGERLSTEIQLDTDAYTITFEPNGERLWAAEFSYLAGNGSKVHVFEVESGTRVRTLDLTELGVFGYVAPGSLIFREDGELAITASSDSGIVVAWLPDSGRRLWNYDYGGGIWAPVHAAFGRSGERVYVWGQGDWTPRIVSAEDGSTLLDLAGRHLIELLPLPDERSVAAWGLDGLEVIDTDSGVRRWARIETGEDDWLLSAPTRHVDGTREALEETWLVLPERACSLDALAAALLDPKKVRAAAEGVELAPVRIPAMPELLWDSKQPRVVRLSDDQEPPAVTLVGRCPDGVAGFELLRNGKRQRLNGEEVSPTERRLTFQLQRPAPGESIDYRWRTIGTKGVLSRALHLTVELER